MHHTNLTAETRATDRSFTVAYEPFVNRFKNNPRYGMPWVLRKYGQGHWCIGTGNPNHFVNEADAYAAGERWLETGMAN